MNSNGYELEYFSYVPVDRKATLFWAHGFAEHCSRPGYKNFFSKLKDEGFAVFCINHQGHGHSYGDSNFVERFEHYIDDFLEFVQINHDDHYPTFIAGHSMGSIITLKSYIRKPELFKAAAVSSLCSKVDAEIATPTTIAIVNTFSEYLPKMVIDELKLDKLSRNEDANVRAQQDPLHNDTKLGFRFSAEFLKTQSEINEAANSILKPLAFFHGTGDDICPTLGSIEYYNAVPKEGKNKELFLFEGMRHEPFEDPEFELFFEKFTNWFQSQI